MTAETRWTPGPPPKLTAADRVFPARAMDWLPPMADIPREFRMGSRDAWSTAAAVWFFKGPDRAWLDRITPKPGIDKNDALQVVQGCLGSFAPKHEHKMAGVAYLLSLWFDDPALATREPTP